MTHPELTFTSIERNHGERFKSLRRELGVEGFGINEMVLEPRQRGRIHAHENQEEVYIVLQGELTLIVEGEQLRLAPDQLVRVPGAIRRQLVNAGRERLVMLALGGSGEHVGRDARAWVDWSDAGPGKPPQEIPLPEDL